jgi:hypothetical protein
MRVSIGEVLILWLNPNESRLPHCESVPRFVSLLLPFDEVKNHKWTGLVYGSLV